MDDVLRITTQQEYESLCRLLAEMKEIEADHGLSFDGKTGSPDFREVAGMVGDFRAAAKAAVEGWEAVNPNLPKGPGRG